MIHRFPTFEIDEDKREARVGSQVVNLQPRIFDLLAYLAKNHERVVPKDELLDAVWPGVIVSEGSLQRAISLARAAFSEAGIAEIVRTFPRQGYRLRADSPLEAAAESHDSPDTPDPEASAGRVTARQHALIQEQLGRLEKQGLFEGSPRFLAMLRYMVAAELSGHGDRTTPGLIARNLPRTTGSDPAHDDLAVRIEVGELRARLDAYNAAAGRGDRVRIELPGGRFSPRIFIDAKPLDTREIAPKQEIRFLRTDDNVSLAYAVSGYGYPLVKAANWLSHLEYDHESPIWRHWWRALGERYQLIRYDERGCGLSDWNPKDFSYEAWVRDLEQVADASGVEKFALLGISQGASVAIDYAVRHPERVSHLILYGGYVLGRAARATNPIEAEEADAYLHMVKVGWGRGNTAFREFFMSMFMPDATEAQVRTFLDLQRVTASPENAERFNMIFRQINTTKLAKQVRVPTLVIHATEDRVVPAAQARLVASLIPGSRLALLEGRNHILCEDEPAWSQFLDELMGFIGSGPIGR